ncbi:calcium-binding protein [Rubripirellula amarantea]|nr:calcium-binding protein [Rubripirellula amarantea]
MAADIDLFLGTLSVRGDAASDQIIIREIAPAATNVSLSSRQFQLWGSIEVSVTNRSTQASEVTQFSRFMVRSIFVDAGGGSDVINNQTNLRSTLRGGSGTDYIYGGSSADMIFGDGSRDYLYGRNGDDIIEGGSGSDFIYGGNHADILRGGSGTDYLYGNGGNDRLVGGSHFDILQGGSGHDSLISGNGNDLMYTNSGRDRVLRTVGSSSTVMDLSSDDVQIDFINPTADEQFRLGSNIGSVTAEASTWDDDTVEKIDDALQMMFDATNNNALLQKANGDRVNFARYGELTEADGDINTNVLGWNGDGNIVIIDNAIDRGRINETVIHELAHNFDEQDENIFVNVFRAAGSWTTRFRWQSTAGLTQADDDRWSNWYFNSGEEDAFAREYGTMNPLEDFATSVTAKILSDNGMDYFGESPDSVQTRMQERFDVLDDFFAYLA